MRHVEIRAEVRGMAAEAVFRSLLRWELPDLEAGSSWDWEPSHAAEAVPVGCGVRPRWLAFPAGTLRWTEEIRSDPGLLRIHFHQVEGDFAGFAGTWAIRRAGAGTVDVRYEVDFDFGIASMDSILDPVAESTVRSVIGQAITSLSDDVRFVTATDSPGL